MTPSQLGPAIFGASSAGASAAGASSFVSGVAGGAGASSAAGAAGVAGVDAAGAADAAAAAGAAWTQLGWDNFGPQVAWRIGGRIAKITKLSQLVPIHTPCGHAYRPIVYLATLI